MSNTFIDKTLEKGKPGDVLDFLNFYPSLNWHQGLEQG